jgi:adenosylcobinamide-phosphate synthase
MSFLAVLLALLLEQARPLPRDNAVHDGLRAWSRLCTRSLDAGDRLHGWLAWGATVLLPTAASAGLYWALWQLHGLAAFVWVVVVLYWTLGFRQFSHHFTVIRDALEAGDDPAARKALAVWKAVDASEVPSHELPRHVIEFALLASHRHVFGVLGWFAVLAMLGAGPAGAVLFRLSDHMQRRYGANAVSGVREPLSSQALQTACDQVWHVLDWLSVRVTSFGFAIVGSFEEAIDCWRNYVQRLEQTGRAENDAVLLAAASGALGLRLGGAKLAAAFDGLRSTRFGIGDGTMPGIAAPMPQNPSAEALTPGVEPQAQHLRNVVGLVWRSVVLWMVLLALLTLARLVG